MNQLEQIRGVERQPPGEQLVQRHPQGIQIGAIVHRSVHAPRLLGRDVGRRTLELGQRRAELRLSRQPRRDPEVDQRDALRVVAIEEEVRGFQIL